MCTTTFRKGVWGVGYALLAVFASHSAYGQVFNESAKLLASDGAAGDIFGHSVSISGDVTIVGATYDDCAAGQLCGSAYVFVRGHNGENVWNDGSADQQAKLTASDAAPSAHFGDSVSVSADGQTALIGAPGRGNARGAAYVFQKIDGVWMQMAILTASDAAQGDWFGGSVSLSADAQTGLIGAPGNDAVEIDSGAAYLFQTGTNGVWDDGSVDQVAKLTCSDSNLSIGFGYSVSLSADAQTALIGAPDCDKPASDTGGSAYVFVKPAGGWANMTQETGKLIASDAAPCDIFGYGISLSPDGQTALIGAYEGFYHTSPGSAYVFDKPVDGWNGIMTQSAYLTPSDGTPGDEFGVSVSLSADGQIALIGAAADDAPATNSGSAYRFQKVNSVWTQTDKLTAFDGANGDYFGNSVCLSGDGLRALIGAFYDDAPASDSGSAYVFTVLGTCCISNGSCEAAGNCQENITPSACQALGGRFFGPDLLCAEVCANGSCIPTVSAWGLIVLLLLLATAGTIVLAHRRMPAR